MNTANSKTATVRHRSFDMGGRRNYDRLTPAEQDAHDFVDWAIEEGTNREIGPRASYAAHAARYLQATAPERFAKAIASRQAGRADDVYAALVALAQQAGS